MIRFGIVLPIWPYNGKRLSLGMAMLASLAKTVRPSHRPVLLFVGRESPVVDIGEFLQSTDHGDMQVLYTYPPHVQGTEMPLAWGTDQLFNGITINGAPVPLLGDELTHVIWMGDDALFKPDWLQQLEGLILRHPKARGWSVYHSAHQKYHTDLERSSAWSFVPLGLRGPDECEKYDVRVRSICGHGFTIAREEWQAWGIDWRHGNDWANAGPLGGNTLDLHHAWYRPGERWVTEVSYIQHTGEEGLHVTKDVPEYGLNW